jgi:hypothetical protein
MRVPCWLKSSVCTVRRPRLPTAERADAYGEDELPRRALLEGVTGLGRWGDPNGVSVAPLMVSDDGGAKGELGVSKRALRRPGRRDMKGKRLKEGVWMVGGARGNR